MRRRLMALLPCLLLAGAAVALPRGTNLLTNPGFEQDAGWSAYEKGFSLDTSVKRDGTTSLRLRSHDEVSSWGAMQRVVLPQPTAEPLRLSGYSRAQYLHGSGDYNLYADVAYADGTALWGQKVNFAPGTHDWEYGELVIRPEKPVKSILLHALLRRTSGTAWFDNLRLELLPFELTYRGTDSGTDETGGRLAFRVEATLPARWSVTLTQGQVRQTRTMEGTLFAEHWAGLKPGKVTLQIEATDLAQGEQVRAHTSVEVLDRPLVPLRYFAASGAGLLAGPLKTSKLTAMRGESESLQVVVSSAFELPEVQVSLSDFTGPGGVKIGQESLSLRRIAPVAGHLEALLPLTPLHLQPWEPQVLWLTVRVPRTAVPGLYRGELRVNVGSRAASPCPLPLTVWNAQLPAVPSIPAVVGIGDQMFIQQLGLKEGTPQWSEALAQWHELLRSYRLSPYFCRFGQQEPNHYAYPSPWPLNDPRSEPYLTGQAAYAIPYPLGGDEAQLRAAVELLKAKGLLDRGFAYLWDEPNRVAHYESIRQWAAKLQAVAPEAKVLTTYYCGPLDGPRKGELEAMPELLRGFTQIFCMSQWATGGCDDYRPKLTLKSDEQWWLYVCCGPGYPQPNLYLGGPPNANRAVMWRLYAQGAEGFLYWCANAHDWATPPGKPLQFREGLPPGDGVLAYPGEAFGLQGPVPSVRLERLREGLEDWEYLQQYEARFGREKTLARLRAVYQGENSYAGDDAAVNGWRETMAAQLGW